MDAKSHLQLDHLTRTLDLAYRDVVHRDHADVATLERALHALDEIHAALGEVLRSPSLHGAALHDALLALERQLAFVMANASFDGKPSNVTSVPRHPQPRHPHS